MRKQLLTVTWVTKTYESMYHEAKTLEVELFTWEKLDYVDKIKEAFGL